MGHPPAEDEAPKDDAEERVENAVLDWLPWDLVRETADQLARFASGPSCLAEVFEAVPCGWYVLARVEPDEREIYHSVCVHEHQKVCWERFIEHLDQTHGGVQGGPRNRRLLTASLRERFFGDCDHPQPSDLDVNAMIEHFKAGGGKPEFNRLEERERCDPNAIARHIKEHNLSLLLRKVKG